MGVCIMYGPISTLQMKQCAHASLKSRLGCQASPRDPSLSSFLALGLQANFTVPGYFILTRVLGIKLRSFCKARALVTELSLQPQILALEMRKWLRL